MTGCAFARVETSFAELFIASTDKGICFLTWCDGGEEQRLEQYCEANGLAPSPQGSDLAEQHLAQARAHLVAYGEGKAKSADLALDLRGTAFQLEAWEVLRAIPFGATITYGEQARRMGNPAAVRAVGGANGRNPVPILVPCHRVVASTGLGGFSGGIERKTRLLDLETPGLFRG